MQKTKPILSDLSISILVPREWGRMVTTAWNTRKWSLSWSPCTPGWWWTCQGWKPSRGSRSWGLNLLSSVRSIQRRWRAIFTLWCKTRDLHSVQHVLFLILSGLRWISRKTINSNLGNLEIWGWFGDWAIPGMHHLVKVLVNLPRKGSFIPRRGKEPTRHCEDEEWKWKDYLCLSG